jgi:glycosyltransferase involved in cell wall biosynthesis
LAATRRPAGAITVVAHEIGAFGGMESQLAELVRRLLDRGIEVTAIARRCDLAPHPRLRLVRVGGPARPFPIAYPWFLVWGSLAVRRARRGPLYAIGAIVLNRVDARKVPFCHLAWARSTHYAPRASRDTRAHRLSAMASAFISRLGERLLYRPAFTGALVAMSHSDAEQLERLFPRLAPVPVIPNGIDTGRFRPDPAARSAVRSQLAIGDDDLVAAFVGGDWRRKGLPVAIEALAGAPRWRLIVAGDGDGDAMLGHAQRHGVADRVTFCGRVDAPERYLAAADALAMPSAYEPWGNAMLEACACGLPVIACRTPGVLDFVADDASGILVEPVAEQVTAALRSLERLDERLRMGVRARQTAERFTFDHVADAYRDLLLGPAVTEPVPPAAAPAIAPRSSRA